MAKDPLEILSARLQRYDLSHVLSSIGALQLLPRNADQAIRLEALGHAAACIQPGPLKPKLSAGRLRQICGSAELSSFVWAEDPCDELFVEEVMFYGGSYRVMPGITETATFIVQHLVKAIFLNASVFPPRQFVREARVLIGTALLISDEIARRAGLAVGTFPVPAHREPIVVPDSATLDRLRSAVSFTTAEMAGLLARTRIPVTATDAYALKAGSVTAKEFSADSAPLLARPMVRVGENFVVVNPSGFLAAARHAVIVRAMQMEVAQQLSSRFNSAVWNTLLHSLSLLRHEPLPFDPPPGLEGVAVKDSLFQFDTDKLAYVLLATDPLNDYPSDEVFGRWNDAQLHEMLQSRMAGVEERIYSALPWVNDILFLVVMQGLGRSGVLGFTDLPKFSSFLAMSASDLDNITLLESGDPLALWKYAGAHRKLHDRAKVITTSILDEFETYRSHKHSFYLSDDANPNLIFIPPGTGGEIRRELARTRACHTVESYTPGHFRRVIAVHDTAAIPIYAPFPIEARHAFLVEGLPALVWIVGPEEVPSEHDYLQKLYGTMLDGIAYWIWQFTPALRAAIEPFAGQVVRISVEIVPDERWGVEGQFSDDDLRKAMDVTVEPASLLVRVTVRSALTQLLAGGDNSGERAFMRSILHAFRSLIPESHQAYLDDVAVELAIERYAPLGLKKMMLFISVEHTPQLDPRNIPRYRRVQEADVNVALDGLGKHLRSTRSVGAIAVEKTNEVMKASVAFFLSTLQDLLASLSPEHLLEYLMRQHEAVSRQTAFSRLTLPTRIACYGSESGIRAELEEENPALTNAALAGRFLIELAAAVPPRGWRPISLSCFDEMRALASHVVNDGMLSDLVHFGLSEMEVSILPSGRLGINADAYRAATNSYMGLFASEEISRSAEGFSRFWGAVPGNPKSELAARLDVATESEFGVSVTELLNFLTEVQNIGYEIDPGVSVLAVDDLVSRLRRVSRLPEAIIRATLDFFSLRPRAGFYDVASPYRPEDVYPWRFNRELSYLRRPFVIRRNRAADEVLWGNRHVEDAKRYLVQVCTSGRLRAKSAEMRRFIGEMNHQQGEAFNEKVAQHLRAVPDMEVRPKFKKLKTGHGTQRPPSDIDVLAADRRHGWLYAIECKGLSAARTPFELATEIEQLLKGTRTRTSMVEKHELRVRWCREHLREIVVALNLNGSIQWRIAPYIIVDQPMLTTHLHESPIPILTFQQMKSHFEQLGRK